MEAVYLSESVEDGGLLCGISAAIGRSGTCSLHNGPTSRV